MVGSSGQVGRGRVLYGHVGVGAKLVPWAGVPKSGAIYSRNQLQLRTLA